MKQITAQAVSHPCFGGGSTETYSIFKFSYFIRSRTPASAGVPLRPLHMHRSIRPIPSHPCFGGGSTETNDVFAVVQDFHPRTPASAGVPLRPNDGTTKDQTGELAPLLRRGFH